MRQPASVPNAATIIAQVTIRFVRVLVMLVNLLSLVCCNAFMLILAKNDRHRADDRSSNSMFPSIIACVILRIPTR